jgi:hypothetical protein
MKSHKRYYFEPTDHPNLHRIVVIMRRPKTKSRFRRIIWWAWHYKFEYDK